MADSNTELPESDALLAWSKALDFDQYVQQWTTLATTGRSDGNSLS
jgi:hypothetical protein